MARRFTQPFMYDFIGASNQTLQGSTEPKESGHSPIISTNPSSRTLGLILSSSHQHQQALALDFAPLLS